MKRTWRHNLNRWFRRRGGLPKSARVPRASNPVWRATQPAWRTGAFARSRFGRNEKMVNWWRWCRLAALGALALGAGWVCWQSWIGLGIFNN